MRFASCGFENPDGMGFYNPPLVSIAPPLSAYAPMPSGVYSRDLAAKFLTCPTALEGQCKQVTVAPDVMREVIRAYQATCAVLIQRFDEHIAQYLADGLLVYLV